LHLVMGPAVPGASVKFRVLIDGQPPGGAHGVDVDEQGNGTVSEQRLYQLIRQANPIADRQFEIEFFAPGVEAFAFTFGCSGRWHSLQARFIVDTMSEKIDHHRRYLLSGAAATTVAAQLGMQGSASAQSAKPALPPIKPGTHVSLGPLKHISAGLLNVAY